MIWITEKDDLWHSMSESSNITKPVIFKMKNGEELIGSIVVEMSGVYYYKEHTNTITGDWLSPSKIDSWKFR